MTRHQAKQLHHSYTKCSERSYLALYHSTARLIRWWLNNGIGWHSLQCYILIVKHLKYLTIDFHITISSVLSVYIHWNLKWWQPLCQAVWKEGWYVCFSCEFPFMLSNTPSAIAYGIYISQLRNVYIIKIACQDAFYVQLSFSITRFTIKGLVKSFQKMILW